MSTPAVAATAFTSRRGGAIGTAGRAVVALRFDHGVEAFGSKVLPLLRQYAVPATLGCYAEMFSEAATGFLWKDVQGWALNDGVEIAGHGYTHRDASGYAALHKEIVASRDFLGRVMPEVCVEGWVNPGVGGTNYDGFITPSTMADFDTTAGRLVLSTYALSSGTFPGSTYQVLNGAVKQGQNHITVEKMTLTGVADVVNHAVAIGAGVTLMLHPSRLDRDGYMTSSELHSLIRWLAGRQTSGALKLMTMSGLALADISSAGAHNLFAGAPWQGTFTESSIGPVVGAGSAIWADALTGGYGGSPREVTVVVTARVAARVLVRFYGAGFEGSRVVNIPAGETVTVRVLGCLPLTGDRARAAVHCQSGSIVVRSLRALPN